MRLEVLVSTMHQKDYSLLDRMNINSDVVVVNQCDEEKVVKFQRNGFEVLWISTTERGVGRSRNRAILASSADIILFADDDVCYFDGYAKTVVDAFQSHKKADLFVFNLESLNKNRPEKITGRGYKLRWRNCLKFGAFRIAVRRETLLRKNVFFSLLFGGGAKYQAGEDNLFITQCLQKGMLGYSSEKHIGTVKQEESTWFCGYGEKYYLDRGALFKAMYGGWARTVLLLFEMRRPGKGMIFRLKCAFKGMKEFSSK